MNAYEYAQANGIIGTDEQIVAQVVATGVTRQPIHLADLLQLLNFRGMLRKTDGAAGDERWKGTLQNLKAALSAMGLTGAVEGYETWFSHVTNPRSTVWDTSRPEYAAQFWMLYQNFAGAAGAPSVEDFQALASLGGGFRFADLTVEQFDSQRTAAAEQAAEEVRRNGLQAKIQIATNRYNAYVDAINAWDGITEEPVL